LFLASKSAVVCFAASNASPDCFALPSVALMWQHPSRCLLALCLLRLLVGHRLVHLVELIEEVLRV